MCFSTDSSAIYDKVHNLFCTLGHPMHLIWPSPRHFFMFLLPWTPKSYSQGLPKPFRTIPGKNPKIFREARPTRPGYPDISALVLASGATPGPESTPPRNSLPGDALTIPFGAVRTPIRPGTLLWAGHGLMCPGPFLPKPRAYVPRTPPGQAKPLWALIGNWHRNMDRDGHMDRDRHRPCIQFLELVPKGKWAPAKWAWAQQPRAQTGPGPNRPGPNGPGPKQARAQMGPGPNGPGSKRAQAQTGPGPNGPGPKWAQAQMGRGRAKN